jgi:hemolysin activation/secretion protein
MKNIVGYILLLGLTPILAHAEATLKSTNISKYSYSRSINKIKPTNTKQISTQELYIRSDELNKNYPIKQIFIKVEGIDFKGDFNYLTKEYLNKSITSADILNINSKITKYFIEQDYLLPQITVNEQNLMKGILDIVVRIGSLKDVIIIGQSNDLIQSYAHKILESKPTTIKVTQRYIALMNKIPGFKLEYKLREDIQDEQNKEFSSVDLVIATNKTKGEVFSNLDNYGINNLGKAQGMVEAQINSALMDGDSVSFTGLTTNHPDHLYDLGIGYGAPVNNFGTRVHFTASHAHVERQRF